MFFRVVITVNGICAERTYCDNCVELMIPIIIEFIGSNFTENEEKNLKCDECGKYLRRKLDDKPFLKS